MSIGPLGSTFGAEQERLHQVVGAQRRKVYHDGKAEAAAGVGEPDGEDHAAAERDADGRRPWEEPPQPGQNTPSRGETRCKNPSNENGNLLDLDG